MRLLKAKLARSLGLPNARSIEAIWALLSAGADEAAGKTETQERIAFALDDESKELAWWQLTEGDELVVVEK